MTLQEQLAQNVAAVRARMRAAEKRAGRAPGSVLLCAASKLNGADTVRLAAGLEIDVFGENRVQELVEKQAAGAYGEKPLHFIGHLQTNKVRQVVGRAALIQSVDSLRLVEAVEKEAAKRDVRQDILLEVNIGREDGKSGVDPANLERLAAACAACAHVRVRGLMAIPPAGEAGAENRRRFAQMRALYEAMAGWGYANVTAEVLSMGMSGDLENAILEGSTMVRVGTSIFGARTAR